jgi:hypothetical protein
MNVRSHARRSGLLWSTVAAIAVAGAPGASQALPILSDSSTSLNFGDVLIGKSASLSETISNTGTANSTLTGTVKLQNDPQNEFGGPGTVNLSLKTTNTKQPASTTTSYTYAPTNLGSDVGALNVATNGGNNGGKATVQLSGTGVAPVEQVGQANAPFTLVGQTQTGSITVKNVGDGNLAGADTAQNPTNLHGAVSSKNTGVFNLAGGTINLGDGQSQSFGYSFAPTVRGATGTSVTETFANGNSAGNNSGQTVLTTIGGDGVAPVNQVTLLNAGPTRIGTAGTASVTVANIGDGNLSGLGSVSNLNGTVGASSGIFSGSGGAVNVADNASTSFSYTFAPTAQGTFVAAAPVAVQLNNGNENGTNSAESYAVNLSGIGTGPVLASSQLGQALNLSGLGTPPAFGTYSLGNLMDFGRVHVGAQKELSFTIWNATTDNYTNLALAGLSIVSGSFEGPGAGAFSVGDPIAGAFGAGGGEAIDLIFQPTKSGIFDATFNLFTDQDAAFGGVGDIYSVRVTGRAAAPEPMSLSLFGFSMLMGMAARRRLKS